MIRITVDTSKNTHSAADNTQAIASRKGLSKAQRKALKKQKKANNLPAKQTHLSQKIQPAASQSKAIKAQQYKTLTEAALGVVDLPSKISEFLSGKPKARFHTASRAIQSATLHAPHHTPSGIVDYAGHRKGTIKNNIAAAKQSIVNADLSEQVKFEEQVQVLLSQIKLKMLDQESTSDLIRQDVQSLSENSQHLKKIDKPSLILFAGIQAKVNHLPLDTMPDIINAKQNLSRVNSKNTNYLASVARQTLALSDVYAMNNKPSLAEDYLNRVQDLISKMPSSQKKTVLQANLLLRQGQYQKAADTLREVAHDFDAYKGYRNALEIVEPAFELDRDFGELTFNAWNATLHKQFTTSGGYTDQSAFVEDMQVAKYVADRYNLGTSNIDRLAERINSLNISEQVLDYMNSHFEP